MVEASGKPSAPEVLAEVQGLLIFGDAKALRRIERIVDPRSNGAGPPTIRKFRRVHLHGPELIRYGGAGVRSRGTSQTATRPYFRCGATFGPQPKSAEPSDDSSGVPAFCVYCAPNEAQSPLSERSGTALQLRSGRFDSGMGFIHFSILARITPSGCSRGAGRACKALALVVRLHHIPHTYGTAKERAGLQNLAELVRFQPRVLCDNSSDGRAPD